MKDFSDQILLFNKPYRWTSYDVVRKVKGAIIASMKRGAEDPAKRINLKVGHAGTLDPLATGLLIICTGSSTKKIQEIQDAEKEYTGTIVLGSTSASHDLETEIIHQQEVISLDHELMENVRRSFIGTQEQTPPVYSAVKVKGQRAYALARKGKTPEIKPKIIEISAFEITRINLPEMEFRVVCSKGTYIRTLAKDFGESLGTGAYLSALCRTRIGAFRLENALEPIDFSLQLSEKEAD